MATKVLLVEDDQLIGELLFTELKNVGFDVFRAINGQQVFAYLETNMPEIILLDIILPDMNGFDILKKLKADAKTSQVPVMILSNLSSSEDMEKGKSLGAVAYHVKANILPKEVVEKIKDILK